MEAPVEIWKQVPDYPLYAVSTHGRIKRLDTGQILHRPVMKIGYINVRMHDPNKPPKVEYIHRLVAQAFIPNPDNFPHINHIDGDKTNNRVENLEWSNARHNQRHAMKTGLRKSIRGCCSGLRPVVAIDLDTGMEIWYESAGECGRAMGIRYQKVHKIAQGKMLKPFYYHGHHYTFWFADELPGYQDYNAQGIRSLSEFVYLDAMKPGNFDVESSELTDSPCWGRPQKPKN